MVTISCSVISHQVRSEADPPVHDPRDSLEQREEQDQDDERPHRRDDDRNHPPGYAHMLRGLGESNVKIDHFQADFGFFLTGIERVIE